MSKHFNDVWKQLVYFLQVMNYFQCTPKLSNQSYVNEILGILLHFYEFEGP